MFFTAIHQMMTESVDLTIVIRKTNGQLTVSTLPKSNGLKDEAQNHIVPLTVTGTPQELDTGFLQAVTRPIQQDGVMTTMPQSVKAPFIGLVPIPSLLIDRVDVDFQMEVTDTSNVKSTINAKVETKVSGKSWLISAEISGKVTTARENTRMTNQTAKYQIHVSASQQPQTEGLSKLMDIMASCIEPINTESSK